MKHTGAHERSIPKKQGQVGPCNILLQYMYNLLLILETGVLVLQKRKVLRVCIPGVHTCTDVDGTVAYSEYCTVLLTGATGDSENACPETGERKRQMTRGVRISCTTSMNTFYILAIHES